MSEAGFRESSLADQQQLPPERKGLGVWPWLILLGLLAALVVLRGSGLSPADSRGERHPAVGAAVPALALVPLTGEGEEVTLDSLDGKVTLVNFWGPWCPACVVEFPHLVEIEQHYRSEQRFQFLSVSSNYNPLDDKGLAESTAAFLKRHKAEFPTYRDPGAQTMIALERALQGEQFGYPTTIVIGPDRAIKALWVGYVPGDEREVEEAIKAALRG